MKTGPFQFESVETGGNKCITDDNEKLDLCAADEKTSSLISFLVDALANVKESGRLDFITFHVLEHEINVTFHTRFIFPDFSMKMITRM